MLPAHSSGRKPLPRVLLAVGHLPWAAHLSAPARPDHSASSRSSTLICGGANSFTAMRGLHLCCGGGAGCKTRGAAGLLTVCALPSIHTDTCVTLQKPL